MKIIECPRDAMQGIKEFIPTELKIAYINSLLKVGFDTIDFGSFVSPKVTPQMKDTAEVLEGLDLSNTKSKLLAIVASFSGARSAVKFPEIKYLGFPFSVSETFQMRNTNKTILEALACISEIQDLCVQTDKELVVYLSMGFGNPYGDAYNPEVLEEYTERLKALNINTILLSDTIGVSNPSNIIPAFQTLIQKFPSIEFGAHFHSNPKTALEKIEAAYSAGCRRFDSAIGGFGGCPMAKDELTGNIATETMLSYFIDRAIETNLNFEFFSKAVEVSQQVFPKSLEYITH
jgi:hydroxymethylglutaryl-CoA lyase